MSLLNKASLIQIPSGYKDGTLYSAKPTNGDGDFTFSRGSNLAATRVNSEGLIEKGRENLFLYSQDFSQSNWQVLNVTKVSTNETDPNGGSTACNITWASGAGTKFLFQNISTGNLLCVSMYVKSNGGGNKFRLFGDGATDYSQDFTATSEWQRFEFFFERGSGLGTGIASASDNSAADLLVAFAQTELGLVATDYIETTTTTAQAGILEDMPRLDYSGGASCPALKLEPQRTNKLPQSEYFGAWNPNNATLTANAYTSPEGYDNAYKMVTDGINAGYIQSEGAIVVYSGTTYAFSMYFNTNSTMTGDMVMYVGWTGATGSNRSGITFTIETGAFVSNYTSGSGAVIDYDITTPDANGWYRVSFWANSTNTATGAELVVQDLNLLGDGSKYLLIYGGQMEEGSYPTSYIPTYGGSSVTRSQDYCVKTGISSLIGQTEGTFFAEFEYNGFNGTISQNVLYTRAAGSTSNYLYINIYNGRINIGLRVNSTTLFDTLQGPNPLSEGVHKCAFAYKSGDIVIYLDGQNIYVPSNNVYSNLSLAELGIGNNTTGGNQLGDGLNQVLVFKTRLTNDELATLTTI